MKYLQFLRIQHKKSRQFQQQLHCLEPHPRASVSDQSQTSDAHVNRVQAQGQGGDKSKHKFVYLKQWKKEYPWVNPLENVSLIVCFAETTSIKRYQTEVVFQFACQYGPTKDSTLDNIHQLIKFKFGQNRNISKTTAKTWYYQRYNDNDDMFTKSDIYTKLTLTQVFKISLYM